MIYWPTMGCQTTQSQYWRDHNLSSSEMAGQTPSTYTNWSRKSWQRKPSHLNWPLSIAGAMSATITSKMLC